MEHLQKTLDEIVSKISYLESKRLKIGQFLKEINDSMKIGLNEEIKDEKIINKVSTSQTNKMSVLGIDGGIVKHSYHGLDLMLTRSVGVNFIYSDGKMEKVDYYPNSNPTPIAARALVILCLPGKLILNLPTCLFRYLTSKEQPKLFFRIFSPFKTAASFNP